ncbi:unnamed protein product [Caenorhabditis brenneri]
MQPKNGMATKEDIEGLFIFIGGFEKWPLLNEDCRREVVKYLDYESRFNLGICSKDDHETVEKTKICVEGIGLLENRRLHYQKDNVSVQIRFPNGISIEWIFSQHEKDTCVQWLPNIPNQDPIVKEVIWKSCGYYEEAVKFAEKWMNKSNFELEEIRIEMAKYPSESSQIKLLPCCKEVRISADDVDQIDWWLRKVPEQLDLLQLCAYSGNQESLTFPSIFFNAPQILQASKFNLWRRSVVSDEQLLKLNGKSMSFDCVVVTDIGINQFIKSWVNGKGVNGFEKFQLWSTGDRDSEVMVAGLGAEEWDQTFGNEHWAFVKEFKRCYGRGQCYQIKSKVDRFESLTLSIHEDRLGIYATGKRVENDGEVSTGYRVP